MYIIKPFIGSLFVCVALILSACIENFEKVILPNGSDLSNKKISEIVDDYSLVFHQYEGFKGVYNDTLLSSFVVISESELSDILSEDEIHKIEKSKVKGVIFDKIPDTLISMDDLIKKLKICYKINEVKSISSNEKILLKDNEDICKVKFVPYGIPGFIISIGKE